jgi:hypothetical protein
MKIKTLIDALEVINARSGQENDIRYFGYAIQAYYQGVLK